jgi:large subunit ribosomal protein L13
VAAVKTYMAKPTQVERRWWVVDATDAIVGRLASDIAVILMGKHRPTYTPHVDTGDFVIVTNVEKVTFSGNKWQQKVYTRYSGYPGLKTETADSLRQRRPERIVHEAVRRMLPKSKLGRKMISKLKLYVGPDHPHQAQQPEQMEVSKRVS